MSVSKATGFAAIGFATVLALIVTGCASSEAGTRKGMKRASVVVQPQEKPHQLRYYGGPKSPMS